MKFGAIQSLSAFTSTVTIVSSLLLSLLSTGGCGDGVLCTPNEGVCVCGCSDFSTKEVDGIDGAVTNGVVSVVTGDGSLSVDCSSGSVYCGGGDEVSVGCWCSSVGNGDGSVIGGGCSVDVDDDCIDNCSADDG